MFENIFGPTVVFIHNNNPDFSICGQIWICNNQTAYSMPVYEYAGFNQSPTNNNATK